MLLFRKSYEEHALSFIATYGGISLLGSQKADRSLHSFNLGVILQVASTEQKMFIAGRFFAGLGVGLVSVQIPMYQAETLPKWIRGALIGAYQLCITIGLLVASLVNYGKHTFSVDIDHV